MLSLGSEIYLYYARSVEVDTLLGFGCLVRLKPWLTSVNNVLQPQPQSQPSTLSHDPALHYYLLFSPFKP